jgi:uncharacterized OB-fold protein
MGEVTAIGGINDTQTYWDAAVRGELLLKRCIESGKCFHYPREHSPFTGGRTEWIRASGFGMIYSCSVSYRAKPNYCIAYIKLDEGPIVLSNVEHSDLAQIAIGQRVRVVFRAAADGRQTPFFVLAD